MQQENNSITLNSGSLQNIWPGGVAIKLSLHTGKCFAIPGIKKMTRILSFVPNIQHYSNVIKGITKTVKDASGVIYFEFSNCLFQMCKDYHFLCFLGGKKLLKSITCSQIIQYLMNVNVTCKK